MTIEVGRHRGASSTIHRHPAPPGRGGRRFASLGVVYAYSAYGETAVLGPDDGNSLRYTSREEDAPGLYHHRARSRHLPLPGWLSEDPIGIDGGINPRAYVEGDPVSLIDPDGQLLTGVHAFQRGVTVEQATQVGAMGNDALVAGGVGAGATGAVIAAPWATTAAGSAVINMATHPTRVAIIGTALRMLRPLPGPALPPVPPPARPTVIRPAPQMQPPKPPVGFPRLPAVGVGIGVGSSTGGGVPCWP